MSKRRIFRWVVIVSVALLTLPTALHLAAQDVVPNELELVGIIDSIDGDTITVNGQVFDISNVELEGELAVREIVKIHASLSDTDAWVVREVETAAVFGDDDDDNDDRDDDDDDDVPEFDITGILEEVGEDYVIVSGLRIDTTGAEMESILMIGEMVEIHQVLVEGSLVVREVEMDDDDDDLDDDDDDNFERPHDWVPYIVQPGDTLDDLAAIIGTSPERLAQINGIDDGQDLVAGSILYGPAYSSHDDDDRYEDHGDDDDRNDDRYEDHGDDDDDDDDDHDDRDNHDDDDDDDDDHGDDDHDDDDDDEGSH